MDGLVMPTAGTNKSHLVSFYHSNLSTDFQEKTKLSGPWTTKTTMHAYQATAIQLAGDRSTLLSVINAGWLLASSDI